MEKIKVYVFDFGDTDLLTTNPKDILDHIESDLIDLLKGVDRDPEECLQYTISVKFMTQEEFDSVPDWS